MNNKEARRYPVVVAGAGPAGLVTAITLAKAGIATLVVERRTTPSTRPRATVLSIRTMELLRTWGLADRVTEGGDDVDIALFATPTLAQTALGERIEVGYLGRAASQHLSPTSAVCVPQDHLEQVLLDHLASVPAARLVRGTEVRRAVNRADGVTVTLGEVTTGIESEVAARYVVAADGAHSRIRSSLGIEMQGPDGIFAAVSAEFHGPLWDVVGADRYLLYAITDPAGEGVILPAAQGDRWIYSSMQPTWTDRMPSNDEIEARIHAAIGRSDVPIRITDAGRFTAAAQVADSFCCGRVFLAGDAAHRVTPRGGTGLNTAIADGRDLAWKLLWVLRGWAPEALLATYEAERRRPATHNVERSADPNGSRRGAESEVMHDLGGRIGHLWTNDGDGESGRLSSLDLLGDGLTLFSQGGSEWARAADDRAGAPGSPPVTVVELEPLVARGLGIAADGALLVRPDAVPLALWSTATSPEAELRSAIAGLVGAYEPAPAARGRAA